MIHIYEKLTDVQFCVMWLHDLLEHYENLQKNQLTRTL